MGLDGNYKVIKVEERKEDNVTVKFIYVETTLNKCKCPKCGKYTKSVHDKLKPIKLKYVKAFEFITYQKENKNILNKVEQKVFIDLKQYNFSLKYIADN